MKEEYKIVSAKKKFQNGGTFLFLTFFHARRLIHTDFMLNVQSRTTPVHLIHAEVSSKIEIPRGHVKFFTRCYWKTSRLNENGRKKFSTLRHCSWRIVILVRSTT